jgi:nicotinamidase-related amidase
MPSGKSNILPPPPFFDPTKANQLRAINYQEIAEQAIAYRRQHGIKPAAADRVKIGTMGIDFQMTFDRFELPVGGATEDGVRFAQFIYSNLWRLTRQIYTLDTHQTIQIFHQIFWVDAQGNHPAPGATMITIDDVKNGRWMPNPAVAPALGMNYAVLQRYAQHYVNELARGGKYALTIWPYHGMLGGVGHALMPTVEEAAFFHSIARTSQTEFQIKGGNPLTENYSVLAPEVMTGPSNEVIAQRNAKFLELLLKLDVLVIGGEAKSHCVAWTINDLLTQIQAQDSTLAQKVYLLEDCTSPVVIPGVIDFTQQGNEAFDRFAAAGMHVVKSTDPMETWPGIRL